MEKNLELLNTCPLCGKNHSVFVKEEDYFAWQYERVSAQNAFPYLSPTEREQLISGFCPKCQENIFGFNDFDDNLEIFS